MLPDTSNALLVRFLTRNTCAGSYRPLSSPRRHRLMQDQQIPDRLRVSRRPNPHSEATPKSRMNCFGNPEPAAGSLEPVG